MLSAVVSYGQSLPFGSHPASSGGGGSFTVIQSTTSASSGTWATAITPTATGHLLAGTGVFGNSGCAAGTQVVSDTAGNTWFIDKSFVDSVTNFTFIAFHALANGTSSTTISVTAGACFAGSIAVAEVSGVNTLDVAGTASSGPSSVPTLVLATNHSGEFCAVQGNLVDNPGGYNPTFSQLQPLITGGGLGGAQFVSGPSTGTSTTFASTTGYGVWALTGACYK